MENGNSSEVRILFVRLDDDGYPVAAQELVEGSWVEVAPDAYFDVPDDLYLSQVGEVRVWSDEMGFSSTALVVPGEPPTPQEAEATACAYLEHLRSEDEEAELDGVVFVYDPEAESDD